MDYVSAGRQIDKICRDFLYILPEDQKVLSWIPDASGSIKPAYACGEQPGEECVSDMTVPPEYRLDYLSFTDVEYTEAGRVYQVMTIIYRLVTGGSPPMNFQLTSQWKEYLYAGCGSWPEAKRSALFELFHRGTMLFPGDRYQSIEELMRSEPYRILTS